MAQPVILDNTVLSNLALVGREVGVPTTGTVGVLALSVKRGLISLDEGNRLLKQMIEHRYRSPVEKLDDLLL